MASSGPNYLSTWASTSSNPYDDQAWVNVANLVADDTSYAVITHPAYDANVYSFLAIGTVAGFSLPPGAVINGITVEINGEYTAGTASIVYVALRKDGALWGTAKTPSDAITADLATYTYGSTSDQWGIASPTGAHITETDFGIAFAVQATAANTDIAFDFARITITYTGNWQLTASSTAASTAANATLTKQVVATQLTTTAASAGATAANATLGTVAATQLETTAASASAAFASVSVGYRFQVSITPSATATATSATLDKQGGVTRQASASSFSEASFGSVFVMRRSQLQPAAMSCSATSSATLLEVEKLLVAVLSVASASSADLLLLRRIRGPPSAAAAAAAAANLTLTKQNKTLQAASTASATAGSAVLARRAQATASSAAAASAANASLNKTSGTVHYPTAASSASASSSATLIERTKSASAASAALSVSSATLAKQRKTATASSQASATSSANLSERVKSISASSSASAASSAALTERTKQATASSSASATAANLLLYKAGTLTASSVAGATLAGLTLSKTIKRLTAASSASAIAGAAGLDKQSGVVRQITAASAAAASSGPPTLWRRVAAAPGALSAAATSSATLTQSGFIELTPAAMVAGAGIEPLTPDYLYLFSATMTARASSSAALDKYMRFNGVTGDGFIQSIFSNYGTARTGGTLSVDTAETYLRVGQAYVDPSYFVWQSGIAFITTALPDGAVVTSVRLELSVNLNVSDTDFTLEVRTDDWGATWEIGDFISGTALGSSALLASGDTSSISGAEITLSNETAFNTAINVYGTTYLHLSSSRQRVGDTPIGNEYLRIFSANATDSATRPRLFVYYTEALPAALTPAGMVAQAVAAEIPVRHRFKVAVATSAGASAANLTLTKYSVEHPLTAASTASANSTAVLLNNGRKQLSAGSQATATFAACYLERHHGLAGAGIATAALNKANVYRNGILQLGVVIEAEAVAAELDTRYLFRFSKQLTAGATSNVSALIKRAYVATLYVTATLRATLSINNNVQLSGASVATASSVALMAGSNPRFGQATLAATATLTATGHGIVSADFEASATMTAVPQAIKHTTATLRAEARFSSAFGMYQGQYDWAEKEPPPLRLGKPGFGYRWRRQR